MRRTVIGVNKEVIEIGYNQQASLISLLDEMLEKAKSGEITGMLGIFTTPDKTQIGYMNGGAYKGNIMLVIAGLAYLQNMYINQIQEINNSAPSKAFATVKGGMN